MDLLSRNSVFTKSGLSQEYPRKKGAELWGQALPFAPRPGDLKHGYVPNLCHVNFENAAARA